MFIWSLSISRFVFHSLPVVLSLIRWLIQVSRLWSIISALLCTWSLCFPLFICSVTVFPVDDLEFEFLDYRSWILFIFPFSFFFFSNLLLKTVDNFSTFCFFALNSFKSSCMLTLSCRCAIKIKVTYLPSSWKSAFYLLSPITWRLVSPVFFFVGVTHLSKTA